MFVGQGIRPEGTSHVPVAGVPERQGIEQRWAQYHFVNVGKSFDVPHALPVFGQVAMAWAGGPLGKAATVDVNEPPTPVSGHDREHAAALELLVGYRTHNAQRV